MKWRKFNEANHNDYSLFLQLVKTEGGDVYVGYQDLLRQFDAVAWLRAGVTALSPDRQIPKEQIIAIADCRIEMPTDEQEPESITEEQEPDNRKDLADVVWGDVTLALQRTLPDSMPFGDAKEIFRAVKDAIKFSIEEAADE
jgi:hypothetical protein